MLNKLILFLVILMAFRLPAFSQVRQAEKEMKVYHFPEAIALLQQALQKGNKEEERHIATLLGDCYRMTNRWTEAKTYYKRAIVLGDPSPELYFYLAQAYRITGDYEEAQRLFLQSEKAGAGNLPGSHFAASCDSAARWLHREPGYDVWNLKSVNSPQSEFGVVMIPEGLLSTSDRLELQGSEKVYSWTGNGYLRLWLSASSPGNQKGAFQSPVPYGQLSDREWHNGPLSFNHDFTEVFMNRTLIYGDQARRDPGKTRTHLLKIYTSTNLDGKWSKAVPFFLNHRDYSVGHPALSPDGSTLYFVSDQPGGYGGTDIYRCIRKGEVWSEPENLGPVVNTPGNEMFPFITEAGDLWFSSDFHAGFGGLDLFVTRQENPSDPMSWRPPQNPGYPLNSSYDDFSIWTDPSGFQGYFSSNRPGGAGQDDIYRFERAQGSTPLPDTITPSPHHHITTVDSLQLAVSHLELNKPYLLENIFYDFDKWDIREDARPALDSLVRIMKAYPVTIELGSHTDCRGTDEYNRELSQKRAESAVAYIIEQGIDASRITAKGYGESQPVNRCTCESGVTCSEAEHQANRRTEFRILSLGH